MKPQKQDDGLIECYRCAERFKSANWSGDDKDYKQKKWYCDKCFGFIIGEQRGRASAFKEMTDISLYKRGRQDMKEDIIKEIGSCGEWKCGFSEGTCPRIEPEDIIKMIEEIK